MQFRRHSSVTMRISGISFDEVECVGKRKTMMARERSIYLSRPDCSVVRREKARNERDCGSKALDIQTKIVSRRNRSAIRAENGGLKRWNSSSFILFSLFSFSLSVSIKMYFIIFQNVRTLRTLMHFFFLQKYSSAERKPIIK